MLFFSLPYLNVSNFIWFPLILSRYASDNLIIAKIGKRNEYVITCDRAAFLAFTQPLIALYQCIKFLWIPFNTLRYTLRKTLLCIAKIRKGNSSVITCERVMVLALFTSSGDLLSMYKDLFYISVLYFQGYGRAA